MGTGPRTIAVFGAGPALGMAVARRFGQEGFRVALVARDQARLATLAGQLTAEGIQATAFPADLADREEALRVTREIQAGLGPVDVLEYSPGGDSTLRRNPSQVEVPGAEAALGKFVLTPISLVRQVLPGMVDRGDGALLVALGASAKYPMPQLAGGGMALAALRNYILALHTELAPAGVYAGALLIGALIEGSAAHRNASAWGGGRAVGTVTAADLAGRYWDMYIRRDRAEEEVIRF